ncbi:MAG TPA: hypothetical protein PKD50_20140, partial [Leptospiraceae bacterium]|nr:hypothetical protein [Leptospiraceae bacterium]
EQAIERGRRIVVVIYSFQPKMEKTNRLILSTILSQYKKTDMHDSIYSVLFESIMNCIKANAKRIFFEECNLNIKNLEDYKSGISDFKEQIGNKRLRELCEKGRSKKIFIKVVYTHSQDGLKIEILNNAEILKEEEMRIRTKLSRGQKYENLFDFYNDNSDPTEGEGLGLVLSLLMLKGEGVDPANFRIGSKDGVTKTRIEIPFNEYYKTERNLYTLNLDSGL